MKLDELIDEFTDLDPEDKLEWLVEFADELPEISPDRAAQPFPETCRVQECQTPVFLWADVIDGKVRLEADVPRKSPTVRGLVALLVVGLDGATPDEVIGLPDDLLNVLGLSGALGMTRQQGFRGLMARLKKAAQAGSAG